MKLERILLPSLSTFILVLFLVPQLSAQFNIKLPKIGKTKTDSQTAAQTDTSPTADGTRQKTQASGHGDHIDDPEMTNTPQFLLESLEIKAHNNDKYAKFPTQNDYSSWFPQVDFDLLYSDAAPKLRWQADWYKPDGSLWFSEPLEFHNENTFPHFRSPYDSVDIDPKGIVAVGTYGLKITDTKTSQVVFQGKFKVSKTLPDPQLKNKNLFYVENDWDLPIGYVGFARTVTDYDVHTQPMALFWFKGVPASDNFEGELYFNGQRISTTNKGGHVNKYADRGEDCYMARDLCAQSFIGFEWGNFVLDNSSSVRQNNQGAHFTNDHPGEYTIKVFYNGDQVREAKFTIDEKGLPAKNAFSDQLFLNDHRVIMPVRVMGTMEKWDANAWRTDSFYGNPLKGFAIP